MSPKATNSVPLEEILSKVRSGELEGADLTKVSLKKSDLSGAKLKGAILNRASFKKSNLKGADLSGTNLSKADFTDADLSGADLSGADLSGVYAKGADFSGANLSGVKTFEGNFVNATFKNSDLSGADLSETNIGKCLFESVNATKLKLVDADATDSEWLEVDFTGADLTNACLQNCRIENLKAQNLQGKNSDFSLSSISNADIPNSELPEADFANTLLEQVNFAGSNLEKSLFNVSEHNGVDLTGANIEGASFKSLSGYSEQEIMAFKERGARVDQFLIRRFFRFLKASALAKIILLVIIAAIAAGAYFYSSNPENWSFEKLDRVAQEAKGKTNYDRAIGTYNIIVRKFAANHIKVAHAKNQIGSLYILKEEYKQAKQVFDEVIKNYPDLENAVIIARMGLADNLKEQKKYPEAISAYRSITEKFADYPQAIEAKDRIAKIMMAMGDVDQARAIYEEIKKKYAENAGAVIQAEFDIADLLRSQGKKTEALAKFSDIYEQNADDEYVGARALSNIIQVYISMQKIDEAEKTLASLKAKYPNDLNSFLDSELFIANALSSMQKFDLAEKRLSVVYKNHKEKMQGFWAGISLVDLYSSQGEFTRADQILSEMDQRWGDKENYKEQFEIKKIKILQVQKKYEEAIARLVQLKPTIKSPKEILEVEVLLAQLYTQAKNYDQATVTFNQILSDYSEDQSAVSSALLGLAKLFELKGDIQGSIAQYEKVITKTKNPNTVYDALFNQVRLYRHLKDSKNEERILNQMAEYYKDDLERSLFIQMALSDTFRSQKKYEEAYNLLRPIADRNDTPQAINALSALVRLFSDQGKVDEAEKINLEIATRFPDKTKTRLDAALDTANSIQSSGRIDQALERFRKIAAEDSASHRGRALGSIFHIYVAKGDLEQSRATFDIIQKELPIDSEIRINAQLGMGNLLRFKKKYPEAKKLYDELIQEHPSKVPAAWAMASLAQAYVEQNLFDQAAEVYNGMITQFSNQSEQTVKAYLGLGSIEELKKNFQAALAQYQKAIEKAKAKEDILTAKGAVVRLTAELGDIQKAEQLFEELREQYPDSIAVIEGIDFSIANAYAKHKDFDAAIERLMKIRDTTKNKVNKGNAAVTIANLQTNAGRPDKAITEYKRLEKQYPDDINLQRSIQLGIAQIYVGQKQYQKAVNQYEKLLTMFKDKATRTQVLSQLSQIYSDQGMVAKAEETYKRLEKESEGDPASLYQLNVGLGEIARRRGDMETAEARYQKAYEVAPIDSQKIVAMTAIAQIRAAQGNFDKAREAYGKIEAEFKQNTSLLLDAKLGQASVLQQNGRYDEALTLYKAVQDSVQDAPTKARAEVSIAQIYVSKQQMDEAEKAYEEILTKYSQLRSVVLDAKNGLASLYSAQGRKDEAIDTYSEIEKLTTSDNMRLWAMSSRAKILVEKGKNREAENIFNQIVKQSKFNPNARFDAEMGVANILLQEGKTQQALKKYEDLNKVSQMENQKIATLNAIAQIFMQQKNYSGAKNIYQDMIGQFKENRSILVDAKLGYANVLKEEKNYDTATKQYKEIISNHGDSLQTYWAYMGLAQIQSATGKIDEAAKTYEAVSKKYPESKTGVADAKLNHANMLKNANRRADALTAYEEIIAQYPTDVHSVWALQGKAQIYTEAGDFENSENVYDQIIQKYNFNKDAVENAKLGKAGLYAVAGKTKRAIEEYKKLIPKLKADKALQARNAVANSLLAMQNLGEAEKEFKGILSDYAGNDNAMLDANLGLGELAMSRKKFEKAASIFQKVVNKAKEPSRINWALQSLARAYTEMGNFNKIDQIVEQILKVAPDEVNTIINIRLNAANKLRSEKRFDEAISQLKPVAAKYKGQPQAAWAEHAIAQSLTEQQKYDQAMKMYNDIINNYSTNQTAIVDARLNIGQIELYKGNKDKAMGIFEMIAQTYPEFQQSVSALFNVAQIYEQNNDKGALEKTYRRILERFKGNQTAFINANMGLGNLYSQQRKFAPAVESFKAIYTSYPENTQSAWAMANGARAMLELGNQGDAEALLKKLIEIFPADNEAVVGAKTALENLYNRE